MPTENRSRRAKVLFVGESFTLAHVARPLALASALPADRYDVTLAAAPGFRRLAGEGAIAWRDLEPSIPAARFLKSLRKGKAFQDVAHLERAVDADLALIDEVRPDVVVGDFRLSLSVSARLAKVPYVGIANAYWSPYARPAFPLPELPVNRILGVPLMSRVFPLVAPIGFRQFASPFEIVRRRRGIAGLGHDLRRTYTDADWTVYADAPELAPTSDLPPNHRYIGPILWSPPAAKPGWWEGLRQDRPIVYATPGSSGRGSLLVATLRALADLPVTVIAATAGEPFPASPPGNAYLADYLPGIEAAARSALVVCNGGSPTSHQALAGGAMVLGLASNMDQHLNMIGVEANRAGRLLRSEHATPETIRSSVMTLLDSGEIREGARSMSRIFAGYDAASAFEGVLSMSLGRG